MRIRRRILRPVKPWYVDKKIDKIMFLINCMQHFPDIHGNVRMVPSVTDTTKTYLEMYIFQTMIYRYTDKTAQHYLTLLTN